MTYNEWRDELKSNLLCVSESERRRVLDYYAEAYADRREAGFSEREIIQDFGAPYDAAQRILSENKNGGYYEEANAERAEQNRESRRAERERSRETPPPPPPEPRSEQREPVPDGTAKAVRTDNTWIFVLLCIIFAVPIFFVVLAMTIATVCVCVAPIAVIGSGAAAVGTSIGTMIGGSVAYGLTAFGGGIAVIGLGIILCPLFFKLVGLMWKLFGKFFSWLKSLFSGKERA